MKKLPLIFAAAALTCLAVNAQDKSSTTNAAAEAKYIQAIEGRTTDVLKVLSLTNAAAITNVHDTIMAQYRALRAWHDDNDPKIKAAKGDTNIVAEIKASLRLLHEKFISRLGEDLTPEQVERVKDKMTYGKVQFTFAGYQQEYPGLTGAQKEKVLDFLKQAREEAMDGGSAEEKSAIFNRYKGKINNYLSKEGVKSVRAAKEEQKKSTASAANSPAH